MFPTEELTSQHRFNTVVDRLVAIGSSFTAVTDLSDLQAPVAAISNEIAELRNVAERPTRELFGNVIIENDFLTLQHFNSINQIDFSSRQDGFRVNRFGRIFDLQYESGVVSDVSPLAALTSLKFVSLSGSQIKDFSSLAELPVLEMLHSNRNHQLNPRSLLELNKLNWLSLCDSGINQLDWLSSLSQLEQINLTSNQIRDIQTIGSAFRLQTLDISHNPIESLEPLKYHRNLMYITMLRTLVDDLSPLFDVPKLCYLLIDRDALSRGNISDQLGRLEDGGVNVEVWSRG